jgi:hypothetical protein
MKIGQWDNVTKRPSAAAGIANCVPTGTKVLVKDFSNA